VAQGGFVRPDRLLPLFALAAICGPARAQEASPQSTAPPPVFKAGAQAVVLDVVARDKKGRTVPDLKAEDFTVLEEGVPKAITGFRFVAGPKLPPPMAGKPAPQAPEPDTIRNPILVSLVFDALGSEGRSFARRSSLDLLAKEANPETLFAVFHVGLRLRMLQQFTTDRDLVRAAVELACGKLDPRAVLPDAQQSAATVERASRANNTLGSPPAGQAGAGAGGSAAQSAVEAAFANVELEMQRVQESSANQQQGNTSLFSLFALARQQQSLAGRKAIVYFSEGLVVPSQLESLYRSVVSEANRANVSVYSVDVRGLFTTSDNDRARTALREATDASRQQVTSRGGLAIRESHVMAEETAESAINMNVQGMLGSLAEGTGGRLLANTNDVGGGLLRAVDDLSGYYELVYDPQLAAFDGSFRKVEVRLARKDVVVQTRAGYFALPPGETSVDFPWQLPLVTALKASPLPRDFDFRSAVWHFGAEGDAVRHTLVAEVPLQNLQLDADGKKVRVHFSVMALVRGSSGQVVEHFSQDSPFEAPSEKTEALRLGNALFTRSFRVPPGRYSVELAVRDETAKKTSVRRSVLVVLPAPTAVGLSSLAIVRRTEPVTAGALESPDPLRMGENRIVPWVGEPTFKTGDTIRIYLVAFARAGGPEAGLSLEFAREGEIVGRSTAALPAPDGEGRIPYVAGIPQNFAPGRYELTAVVQQGDAAARERAFFVVAN
jgi:VWFA-related protein